MNKNFFIRAALYVVGLAVMTIGIAISVKSNLGVSPVSSIPYTLTVVAGIEMGIATILFHVVLVCAQALLLRRAFKAKNLLQVPVGVLFGFLTTLSLWVVALFPNPDNMAEQIILMFLSAPLVAFGIFLYVPANFIPLAGEGAMLAVSKVTKVKFSTVKIAFDFSMVAISLVVCLICVGNLGSVGVGTVVSALLVGVCLKAISKALGNARDALLAYGEISDEAAIDESYASSKASTGAGTFASTGAFANAGSFSSAGAFSSAATVSDSSNATAAEVAGVFTNPLLSIMNKDVYTLPITASFHDALAYLSEKQISGAPVVDEKGELAGFISDGDILRYLANEHSMYLNADAFDKIDFREKLQMLLDMRIAKIATKRVIGVNASDDLGEVCYKLAENHLKKAPVMRGGKMIGIINRSNITSYATGLAKASQTFCAAFLRIAFFFLRADLLQKGQTFVWLFPLYLASLFDFYLASLYIFPILRKIISKILSLMCSFVYYNVIGAIKLCYIISQQDIERSLAMKGINSCYFF